MSQKIICEKVLCRSFRKERIWDQILSYNKYSEYIPSVESIKQKNTCPFISEWIINIEGAPFSWQQIDSFEPEENCLRFELIHGDFDLFRGKWRVESSGLLNSTTLSFQLEYSLGIPVIEDIAGNIIQEKLSGFINSMLEAHIKLIENTFSDDRRFERLYFGVHLNFFVDDTETLAELINISRGGMLLKLKDDMLRSGNNKIVCFKLAGYSLDSECFMSDKKGSIRVVFSSPLSQKDFIDILSKWKLRSENRDELINIYQVLSKQKDSGLIKDPVYTNIKIES